MPLKSRIDLNFTTPEHNRLIPVFFKRLKAGIKCQPLGLSHYVT